MGIRAETGSHGIIAVAVAQSLLIDSHTSPSQQVWGLAPHTHTRTRTLMRIILGYDGYAHTGTRIYANSCARVRRDGQTAPTTTIITITIMIMIIMIIVIIQYVLRLLYRRGQRPYVGYRGEMVSVRIAILTNALASFHRRRHRRHRRRRRLCRHRQQ